MYIFFLFFYFLIYIFKLKKYTRCALTWLKPCATKRALKRSIVPSACLFILYTHLLPIYVASEGRSTNSQVLLALSASISICVAVIHLESLLAE